MMTPGELQSVLMALESINGAAVAMDARIRRLEGVAREAEALLTNYLVDGKFPPGSDCELVRDMVRFALRPEPPTP